MSVSSPWLTKLVKKFPDKSTYIEHAFWLNDVMSARIAPWDIQTKALSEQLLQYLFELTDDLDILISALLYPSCHFGEMSLEDIQNHCGTNVHTIISRIQKMETIDEIASSKSLSARQLERMRSMLIVMVGDSNAVLIKLSEQLALLTMALKAKKAPHSLGQIAKDVYVPLANRLGMGQLKWQLEDMAFRSLEPETYKRIAESLKRKRSERDQFIQAQVEKLKSKLQQHHIHNFQINGRSKHIYGIYRKMQKKNVDINGIFDASAIRVIVSEIQDCYTALSVVHANWKNIQDEFDDYIAKPKANGYQSLHTAVMEDGHAFEIQIRTMDMHQQAEFGMAAHWLYKEDKPLPSENKQHWLKQILDWRGTLADDQAEKEDTVYVFTPTWDVKALPAGSTPIDFAYSIHTDIGHRCKGAKCHGKIVPLTYALQTGDYIEILTQKNPSPSLDWIRNDSPYVKTSRAKAKIHQWFNKMHEDEHMQHGRELLEKAAKKHGHKQIDWDYIFEKTKLKKHADVYMAIARGDLKAAALIEKVQATQTKPLSKPIAITSSKFHLTDGSAIMTHVAKCCMPSAEDDIKGYVTIGRGVYIHRATCPNLLNKTDAQSERIIDIAWGKGQTSIIKSLSITAYHKPSLENDVASLLSQHCQQLIQYHCQSQEDGFILKIDARFSIKDDKAYEKLLEHLGQIKNIANIHDTSKRD